MPDASSDPPESTDSPSFRRRLAVWGGAIVAGLLVLVLVAALVVPMLFTSEQLKGYVIPPMEEATGRTVEIDDIRLRVLWTPAVSVSGFRLANRPDYGPEPAVEARTLNVKVAVWPLLWGRIEPTSVELLDPVIRYEVASDGTTNFDDLMAESDTAAADEGGLGVPVRSFRTTGAQVRYADRSTGQALALDFDARLNVLPDGRAITSAGTVDLDSLRALLPDVRADTMTVTDAQVDYDLRVDPSEGRVDLSELNLETAPLTVRTTGTVTGLQARPTLDLEVETTDADLAQLAAFAPAAAVEGLNPRGTIELTATVQGPLPDDTEGSLDSLSIDGDGALTGIGVDYDGRTLLSDLSADLALSLEEAAVRSIDGQLLGASLEGAASVQDPMGEPQVDLRVKTGALNLADLVVFAPPEQVEGYNPEGTLQIDASVTGPLPEETESFETLTIDGAGRLADLGVDYEGTAMLRDLGANLAFSGTSASARGIEGQLLGRPLTGELTVNDLLEAPQVEGQLAGEADLGELTALTENDTEEAAEVRGTADYDVRFSGPADDPDAIRPSGTIRLTQVQYPYESFRHPVEVPEATIQLTGTGLSMDRFTVNTGDQTMTLQTTAENLFPVSKGLAEQNPALAVDFTLVADRLDLVELYPETEDSEVAYSDLFAATLSGSNVEGASPETLAADLYGDVELPDYAVDGRVDIGTFLNDPQRIDDLAFDVQVRDRRLEVQNLSGTTYGGTLAGRITFDQRSTASSSLDRPGGEAVLMAAQGPAAAPAPQAASSSLNYDIQLNGAEAGAFLEDWTTLGRVVNGTLDFTVNGQTPLTDGLLPVAEALTAEGSSVVADGGLSLELGVAKQLVERLGLREGVLTSFRRLGGPFAIRDGALQVGEWTLGGDGTTGQLSGALGLGGRVDLDLQLDLPLSTIQNSRVGSLVGMGDKGSTLLQKLVGGDAEDKTVPVRVGIGGTMREPTVEITDKEAVRSAIQKMAKEQGRNQLRNLFEGGGGG